MGAFAAVVLAGGTGTRLGGADKAALTYAGRPLLEHALAAVDGATETVVVAPSVPTSRPVRFVLEEPPRGGPVAGLFAGRDALRPAPPHLVVLAVDMPLVDRATVNRLLRAAAGHDGAFLTDDDGRRQLAGALDVTALDRVRPDEVRGLPLRSLWSELDVVDVPALGREWRDVDTWSDLADLASEDAARGRPE